MQTGSVLVVEDDVALARNIATLIAAIPARAEIATTVAEALACTEGSAFDVAILDMVLPDGDGIELAPKLHERMPDAELVFVTGRATVHDAARAVELGAAAMLLKPFAPASLISTVRAALDRSRTTVRDLEARMHAHQHRALSQLTSGLAHELRNPLNAALLHLELAKRRLVRDGYDSPLGSLGRVEAELRRLTRTLTEFEDCARPAAIVTERIAASELFELALAGALERARERTVEVVRAIAPDLVLDVDPARLTKALSNLVSNALEAMPAGGTLVVRAWSAGDEAILEVENDGLVIPDVTVIFDPFYSTKPMGTGLGLNIVLRTVTDHHGTVDATSRPGSTKFTLRIPQRGATG